MLEDPFVLDAHAKRIHSNSSFSPQSPLRRLFDTMALDTLNPTDAIKPSVPLARISFTFAGDPLDKTAGNWKKWSSDIIDDLHIFSLGSHIEKGLCTPPDAKTHPIAFRNWTANDKMARAYMRRNCATLESKLLGDIADARGCFVALETYHVNEGPVKQVYLIQGVLTQHIT
jgi:hypothetical protein